MAYQALAQEDDYTQYYLNLPAMNAAYTGMDDYLNVNTGVREGWNNFGVENSNLYLERIWNVKQRKSIGS
ncbi:MAG: type IX secretion system membrane protein PorP/SprF [Flammeovirgaceae bacterium]|nr:type IX secretion system membrane protein PorP/SprF [Flammeovirgaceae bacterium]